MKSFLSMAVVCLLPIMVWGGVLHVPSEYSTITEAIAASVDYPDTIILAPGYYDQAGFMEIGDFGNVQTIMSSEGAATTIIDIKGTYFALDNVVLHGLTFVGGTTVVDDWCPWAYNCWFVDNQVVFRSESYVSSPAPQMEECVCIGNDTVIVTSYPQGAYIIRSLLIDNGIVFSGNFVETASIHQSVLGYNGTVAVAVDGGVVGCWHSVFFYGDSFGDVALIGSNCQWPDPGSRESWPPAGSRENPLIADPLFCDTTLLSGTGVIALSPLLPQNNDFGDLIGNTVIGCSCCEDERGNVDWITGPSGPIDVSDLTFLVAFLFTGGEEPPCMDEANIDGLEGPSGAIDISDLTYLVAYLFTGGPAPPSCPE